MRKEDFADEEIKDDYHIREKDFQYFQQLKVLVKAHIQSMFSTENIKQTRSV